MSRTVGVEYRGRIWVVEFAVNDVPTASIIDGSPIGPGEGIDIIGVEEYDPLSRDRRRVRPESTEGEWIIRDHFFHAAVLYAIADFSGRDFNSEEWPNKRVN